MYYYFGTSGLFLESTISIFDILLIVICGILISSITYFISIIMDKLIPWKTQLANRFLAGILIQFISVMAIVVSVFMVYTQLINASAEIPYQNSLIKLAIIVFILVLIYQIIYFALYSYYSFATIQIEAAKYERKQVSLQLKALKSQLSSHFLFNNLNTISALAF